MKPQTHQPSATDHVRRQMNVTATETSSAVTSATLIFLTTDSNTDTAIYYCIPVSATASRQHLRSATSHQLVASLYWVDSYGCWTFSVVGPGLAIWNLLPWHLHDPDQYYHLWTFIGEISVLHLCLWCTEHIRGFLALMYNINCYLLISLTASHLCLSFQYSRLGEALQK